MLAVFFDFTGFVNVEVKKQEHHRFVEKKNTKDEVM